MEVEADWEVPATAQYIREHGHALVALQFPDALLHVAAHVLSFLVTACPADVKFYVLGDTTFGSCCVDEVAAAHVRADLIVHYGHACLSPVSATPAYFVFGRRPVASLPCAHAIVSCLPPGEEGRTLLVWDPDVSHGVGSVLDAVAGLLGGNSTRAAQVIVPDVPGVLSWSSPSPRLLVPSLPFICRPSSGPARTPELIVAGFRTGLTDPDADVREGQEEGLLPPLPPGSLHVVYIGSQAARARTLLAQFATDTLSVIDPTTGLLEALPARAAGKLMSARYRAVEVVRGAGAVGLVAGTLGVARHTALIARLRAAAASAGVGCYTLLVGKPTPAKLGNFPDLDAFVLIACPESSLPSEEEARAYPAPLVTPHEALVAWAGQEEGGGVGVAWRGRSVVDFDMLLSMGRAAKGEREGEGEETPTMSFVTGRLSRQRSVDRGAPPSAVQGSTSTALATAGSSAMEYLITKREWRGLAYEGASGEGAAPVIHEGTVGRAARYEGEGSATR